MQDPDATIVRPPPAAPRAAAADPDATIIRPLALPIGSTVARAPLPPPPRPTAVALPVGFKLHEYRIDGVLGRAASASPTWRPTSTSIRASRSRNTCRRRSRSARPTAA